MSRAVIDTSVLLCVLLNERGLERALEVSEGAAISSVNVSEAIAKCLEKDVPERLALLYLHNSRISVIDFDVDCATLAGRLWKSAPRGLLSLGDRACIATAIRTGGTAITADRVWSTLDFGCRVELIR